MYKKTLTFLFLLGFVKLSFQNCTDPNHQAGVCVPLESCPHLKKDIQSRDREKINFVVKSQCGLQNNQPLVCCGPESIPETQQNCTTPEGDEGSCVLLEKCVYLDKEFHSGNDARIKNVRKHQCGNNGDSIMVCCSGEDVFSFGEISENSEENFSITILAQPKQFKYNKTFEEFDCCRNRSFVTLSGDQLPEEHTCGKAPTLVGDYIADLREFPWMVLLNYNWLNGSGAGFQCGGSIINNRYILTAAHCVKVLYKGLKLVGVRAGEFDFQTEIDCVETSSERLSCSDKHVDVQVEKVISHFNYRSLRKINDIALLRLRDPLQFSDFIYPICLPDPNYNGLINGTRLFISGWGTMGYYSEQSSKKLKVDVPLMPYNACKTENYHEDTQFCAGGEQNKDACQGDSGGPLMRYADHTTNPRWIIEGIVSYGKSCGAKGAPAIYTKVSAYLDWIKSELKP